MVHMTKTLAVQLDRYGITVNCIHPGTTRTERTPGLLAIQVAQVDAMSGGRAELGLGTGWFAREHEAYGIPFPAKRFDLLEQQLELVTGLWSTPVSATYSFEGAHYRLKDAPALPKPVQSRVPVIVGGGGPKRTPELAARYATEFNIGFRSEQESAEKFAGVAHHAHDVAPPALLIDPRPQRRTRGELHHDVHGARFFAGVVNRDAATAGAADDG